MSRAGEVMPAAASVWQMLNFHSQFPEKSQGRDLLGFFEHQKSRLGSEESGSA